MGCGRICRWCRCRRLDLGRAGRHQLVEVDKVVDAARLVKRYLAAFGPATARDVAAWAGFTAIGKTLEAMRDELVAYQDEAGRMLYDLPGPEIIGGDFPAPVRFVAEYDNLVLAHADRSRVLPEMHRKKVLLTAGRVCATVLIDGFVGGVWRVELFAKPSKKLRKEIDTEGSRLLDFAAAHELDVRWIV